MAESLSKLSSVGFAHNPCRLGEALFPSPHAGNACASRSRAASPRASQQPSRRLTFIPCLRQYSHDA